MLSLSNAISVDYYPHEHHHGHYSAPAPAGVKYIEPAHAHLNAVKYIQPAHVAPVIKHVPAPVKYIHQEPHPVKYFHQEPHPVKYVHQEPHPVKYLHQEPHPVKYVHQEPHPVKYIDNPHYVKHVEYDEPAHYEFGYDVHDDHTGDYKSHTEKRDGNTVSGRYEVLDPDGFKRIVEYTADEHNGFNAVVRREPTDVKVVKKVYDIQPDYVKTVSAPVAAPINYYQPKPAYVTPSPYVTPQPTYIQSQPKYFAAPVHQKIVAPTVVKQYSTPQYYAPPEHPKFFKPAVVEKYAKPVYDPHTAVKYVTAAPHHY